MMDLEVNLFVKELVNIKKISDFDNNSIESGRYYTVIMRIRINRTKKE